MTTPNAVTVQAPGSIGNLGPGLDVLGCALTGAADTVTVRLADFHGITITDAGANQFASSDAPFEALSLPPIPPVPGLN